MMAPLIRSKCLSEDDHITFTFGIGPWVKSHEKLTFKQIPYTEHSNKTRSFHETLAHREYNSLDKPVHCVRDGKNKPLLTLCLNSEGLLKWMEYLNENLHQYSEIVVVVNNDRRGAHGASQILERLVGELPPVCVILFYSLRETTLADVWSRRHQYNWQQSGFAEKAQEQATKRLFEYWWHANAALVFGECCKKSGLTGDPVITKYELMLMHILASHGGEETPDKLLSIMQQWKGSGKFSDHNIPQYLQAVGSHSSQYEIIKKLTLRGFAENRSQEGEDVLKITPEGARFLSLCHPKTFDPDLPGRLLHWMSTDNIGAMRRYINTVFSRQLRFQRKTSNKMTDSLSNY